MKLLFVHDHPFVREENIVYTGGSFPKNIWSNYLLKFNSVVVYARAANSIKYKNGISSTDNVSFYLTNNYSSAISLLTKIFLIKKELRHLIEKSDIILVRLPSVLGFLAGEQALRMNKKIWVEQVGNAKEALKSHGSVLGKIAAPLFHYENKRLSKKTNFISYVTENKLQIDYPANKNAVTTSLSDVLIYSILHESEINKNRYFDVEIKIGLIGGFETRYKGQTILLKAISLLDKNIKKNIKLNFVGTGNYEWLLELAEKLQLKECIEFIGPLESGTQINEFLKSISLYIQPSLTEGMPRATIEAMAMGCPVIGSRVGGIPDIVSNKFIHKKGDYRSLSDHIAYLYRNRKELHKEALLSLEKVYPYLKSNLDKKRKDFYSKIVFNETI